MYSRNFSTNRRPPQNQPQRSAEPSRSAEPLRSAEPSPVPPPPPDYNGTMYQRNEAPAAEPEAAPDQALYPRVPLTPEPTAEPYRRRAARPSRQESPMILSAEQETSGKEEPWESPLPDGYKRSPHQPTPAPDAWKEPATPALSGGILSALSAGGLTEDLLLAALIILLLGNQADDDIILILAFLLIAGFRHESKSASS